MRGARNQQFPSLFLGLRLTCKFPFQIRPLDFPLPIPSPPSLRTSLIGSPLKSIRISTQRRSSLAGVGLPQYRSNRK